MATPLWRQAADPLAAHGQAQTDPGIFPNSMVYARWGDGPRSVLVIPGGPGNELPDGLGLRMMLYQYRPLLDAGYTVWIVTRKQNMPTSHTIEDMAVDYAGIMRTELDGVVDVVLGISYGGLIAQYLAANHSDCFLRLVVAAAGSTVSEEGKSLEYSYARNLSEGKWRQAATNLINGMFPNLPFRWMVGLGGALLAPTFSEGHEHFAHDVLVEAEAEIAFDSRRILPTIVVPVLLIAGDKDFYFPRQIVEDTARLIPNHTLRVNQGKGHFGAIADRRLIHDVLAFAGRPPNRARP